MIKKIIKVLAIILLVIYIGICTLLYIKQDDLLFHPKPISAKEVTEFLSSHTNIDTLCFVMNDQTRLFGFITKDSSSIQKPIIIYFGGNAEEVSHVMEKSSYFQGYHFVAFNYRGYGLSEGSISQKAMFEDALQIFDKLKKRKGIDSTHIYAMGRSIGTAVATYLSSERYTKATLLITPYESMIDVASAKYPFVPIAWLIKHPFPSKEYAKEITSPMFSVIAKNDQIIPTEHAYRLIENWKGKTKYIELNEDHGTIMKNDKTWQSMYEFMNKSF